MNDIDKLGAQTAAKVRALGKIKDNLDTRSGLVAQELSQVWAALESGQTVNDCKTKKAWANHWHISDRMCRYILRGRAKRTGEHRNRAVPLKEGMVVSVDGRKFRLHGMTLPTLVPGAQLYTHHVDLSLGAVDEEKQPAPKKKAKRYSTKMPSGDFWMFPKTHKTHKLKSDGRTFCGKTPGETLAADAKMSDKPTCRQCQNGEGMDKLRTEVKAATVDPQKDLTKRYRAAKRAAKFYCGMMKELTDGVDGEYGRLLNLYADNSWGDRRYPWTVPSVGYILPKTQKEFQAEYDKALAEFHAVVAEDKAMAQEMSEPTVKKPTRKEPTREELIAEVHRLEEKHPDVEITRPLWQKEARYAEKKIAKYWSRFADFLAAARSTEPQMSEPATALAAAVDGVTVTKICGEEETL